MFPCREKKNRERTKRKGLEATQGGEGREEAQPADPQGFGARERTQAEHTVAIVWSLLPFCQSSRWGLREDDFRLGTRSEESLKVLLRPGSLTRHRSPITPKQSNPFQSGMRFFTVYCPYCGNRVGVMSQSLSGWDGVFHQGLLDDLRERGG